MSLAIGVASAVIAAVIGAAIGIVAGYAGGRTDNLLMRFIDLLMGFPYILLALAIVAALGPGLMNALIAVAAVNIPFFARNIRGVTVGIAHKEFVDAARLSGQGHLRIILTEILPNVVPVIVVAASTTVGWMILETAGLSFLGLGSQPPDPDLGSMLGLAKDSLITDPHVSYPPGLMILIIVMSINLLGDGIRDALDPRLRSGALSRPAAATVVDRQGQVPAATGAGILELVGLRTEFRVRRRVYKAVGGVSLAVRPGECLGIIGESGSGKSVTALSVMGLVASPPGVITGGAAYVEGQDAVGMPYRKLRALRGERVAYIFQDPQATLHPLFTVGDQLVEAIRVHHRVSGREARGRALDLLKQVRIPNAESRIESYPHEMSGGMRQRVGIAMALANDPEIIIADEPTTALDVTVQAQILSLLSDLRRDRGLAIVFITHDFGVVAQLCDRVAVMYAGRIVEEGPTAEILQGPAHPYTARLIACVPELGAGRRQLAAIPGLPPAVDDLPPRLRLCPALRQGARDVPRGRDRADGRGVPRRPLPLSRSGGRRRARAVAAWPRIRAMTAALSLDCLRKDFVVGKAWFGKPKGVVHAVRPVTLTVETGRDAGHRRRVAAAASRRWRGCWSAFWSRRRGRSRSKGTALDNADPAEFGKKIQYVFQDPVSSLNPRKTIRQVMEAPLRHLHRMPKARRAERIAEIFAAVNLREEFLDRYPHEFSGGQAQRIGIARALAAEARILILDEPVSALDVSVQAQVLNLLARLKGELGLTYLFISHDLAVVEAVSDRVAVLYFGAVVEVGRAADVFRAPRHPYTKLLADSAPVVGRELKPPEGRETELPDPLHPPTGCAFRARCPRAIEPMRGRGPAAGADRGAPERGLFQPAPRALEARAEDRPVLVRRASHRGPQLRRSSSAGGAVRLSKDMPRPSLPQLTS